MVGGPNHKVKSPLPPPLLKHVCLHTHTEIGIIIFALAAYMAFTAADTSEVVRHKKMVQCYFFPIKFSQFNIKSTCFFF